MTRKTTLSLPSSIFVSFTVQDYNEKIPRIVAYVTEGAESSCRQLNSLNLNLSTVAIEFSLGLLQSTTIESTARHAPSLPPFFLHHLTFFFRVVATIDSRLHNFRPFLPLAHSHLWGVTHKPALRLFDQIWIHSLRQLRACFPVSSSAARELGERFFKKQTTAPPV